MLCLLENILFSFLELFRGRNTDCQQQPYRVHRKALNQFFFIMVIQSRCCFIFACFLKVVKELREGIFIIPQIGEILKGLQPLRFN